MLNIEDDACMYDDEDHGIRQKGCSYNTLDVKCIG